MPERPSEPVAVEPVAVEEPVAGRGRRRRRGARRRAPSPSSSRSPSRSPSPTPEPVMEPFAAEEPVVPSPPSPPRSRSTPRSPSRRSPSRSRCCSSSRPSRPSPSRSRSRPRSPSRRRSRALFEAEPRHGPAALRGRVDVGVPLRRGARGGDRSRPTSTCPSSAPRGRPAEEEPADEPFVAERPADPVHGRGRPARRGAAPSRGSWPTCRSRPRSRRSPPRRRPTPGPGAPSARSPHFHPSLSLERRRHPPRCRRRSSSFSEPKTFLASATFSDARRTLRLVADHRARSAPRRVPRRPQ